VPFHAHGSGKDLENVVILRNPEEAFLSFRPFVDKHSDAWFELCWMPREDICRPDFPSFYSDIIDANGMQGAVFGFLAAWWPLRIEPNVLLMRFSDTKKDHEGAA
jgi:hypothetical protein